MAESFQLQNYAVQFNEGKSQFLVLVTGSRKYYHILRDIYREKCNRAFEDRNRKFDWGCYIDGHKSDADAIRVLLEMFKRVVCIDDILHQTFALAYHSNTQIGNLVYASKPYSRPVTQRHTASATKLARFMKSFIERHPSYRRSDYLVAVPCSSEKSFDLPAFLVSALCRELQIPNGTPYVRQIVKPRKSMKDLHTLREKTENIQGAFEVNPDAPFARKVVTIIDDIYQSGATLHELATVLQAKSAIVQGLVATKTESNPR